MMLEPKRDAPPAEAFLALWRKCEGRGRRGGQRGAFERWAETKEFTPEDQRAV